MHQTKNSEIDKINPSRPIRLAILLASPLDCQAISRLFAHKRRFQVIEYSTQFVQALERCRTECPDLIMLDPKVDCQSIPMAAELVTEHHVGHLLVLDDRLHESRLATAVKMPATSYFTKLAEVETIQNAILEIVYHGRRMFDPIVAARVVSTCQGLQLEPPADQPSIAHLSNRETEVMRLLAEGKSVRDCAVHLNLSESTIDNHKSRLMKKLQLHKAAQITYRAVLDGLITI